MSAEVRIPTLGESVNEGVILRWIKQDGESVAVDDPLLELETDKASIEIPAVSAGRLKILKPQGATVQVGEIVAMVETATGTQGPSKKEVGTPSPAIPPAAAAASPAVAAPEVPLSPAVRRLVEEHGVDPSAVPASGKGGRLTKADVLVYLEREPATPAVAAPPPGVASLPESAAPPMIRPALPSSSDDEERVPMTYLRKRIADRLVQAQQTAAILTTFNEIDMSAVMALRAQYKDRFKQKYGVGLGFMSFFSRACVAALRELPVVNASIDGVDVVYHKHVHLGIAVGTDRGLVVPVVHNADQMTFAEIEKEIVRLAGLAHDAKLAISDLSGGTFTISNGGVYGSLLSTPILNPPQSAILGMHKIEKRAVVVDDQVVVRPMMYVALSYDHRLIDGEQAVTFLVKLKERLEDPARLLLEI